MKFLFYFSLILIFSYNGYSQNNSIFGYVLDENTKLPISGAKITIVNQNKGTFSTKNGFFKLPITSNEVNIRVSSLGFISKEINININSETFIYLLPNPVYVGNIDVVANISAEEIIKRTIQNKITNKSKLKTFTGMLYSKFFYNIDDAEIESTGNEGSTSQINMTFGESDENNPKNLSIMETISRNSIDYQKNIKHSIILKKRQTANVNPNNNLLSLSNFIDFYDDEVNIINTSILSPINKNALEYYKFKIVNKFMTDNRYIYIIEVIPNSRVHPLFKGTIKIVENTYNLIEVELEPSEYTPIKFLSNLSIKQSFNESVDKIWYPAYLELKTDFDLKLLQGIADISSKALLTSIYYDVVLNQPLSDTVYNNNKYFNKQSIDLFGNIINVDKDADSSDSKYWNDNTLIQQSDSEKEIYLKIDSIKSLEKNKNASNSIIDTNKKTTTTSFFNVEILPYYNFNRVSSHSLGLFPKINLDKIYLSIDGLIYYSFGQKNWYGKGKLIIPIFKNDFKFNINSTIYSEITKNGNYNEFPLILNSLKSLLFHNDYYDYSQKDGWSAGINIKYTDIDLNINYINERNFDINKSTNRSLFCNNNWRENPTINQGNFEIIETKIIYNDFNFENLTDLNKISVALQLMNGKNNSSKRFLYLYGNIRTNWLISSTSVSTIALNLLVEGGKHFEDFVPIQHSFYHRTHTIQIYPIGQYLSAKTGEIAGKEFYSINGELDLSDYWWRILGLPMIDSKGLNLLLTGGYTKYDGSVGFYKTTYDDYYGEIGFAFAKLPVFISDLVNWRFDARWGIGPIASGNFGVSISLTSNIDFNLK